MVETEGVATSMILLAICANSSSEVLGERRPSGIGREPIEENLTDEGFI